ncbi:MAG TPA: amidohydrolase family protein [Chloroflexota bacterium]|nr:amidohydrolase family protein [Chloroflexota bacterium]
MIDFHQHIGHFGRNVEQTLTHQTAHGVEYSVILPIDGTASASEVFPTDVALDAAERYPGRFISFVHVDPAQLDALDRIRSAHSRGAKGFGEHKVRLPVDAPETLAIYKLCGELGLPVLLHFEYRNYNYNFEAFERVLQSFPQTIFIGHAQAWWANISADAPRDPDEPGYTSYPSGPVVPGGLTDHWLSEYPNLYGDLSAGSGLNGLTRDPTFTRGFLERHQRRLLWATDCPCRDGRGDWGREKTDTCYASQSLPVLRDLAPSAEAFERITNANARELLGLA